MSYKSYLLWGIGAVMTVAAIVAAGLLYGNRSAEKSSTAPVAHSETRLNTPDETGENEPILIQHNGEVYSMEGSKILPAY